MKSPIKIVLVKQAIRKDGTCIIFIQHYHSSKRRVLLNTGITIPFSNWNDKQQRVVGIIPAQYAQPNELNVKLRNGYRVVEDLLSIASEQKLSDPIDFLKRSFKMDLNADQLLRVENQIKQNDIKTNLDLFYQIDEYIASKINKVSKDMPRIYCNTKEHLQAFEKFRGSTITFECLDFEFYEKFVDFLSHDYIVKRKTSGEKGLKVNTVGKTINQFRTFCGIGLEKELFRQ